MLMKTLLATIVGLTASGPAHAQCDPLWTHSVDIEEAYYGSAGAVYLGDIDGDGVGEIYTSVRTSTSGDYRHYILSASDGEARYSFSSYEQVHAIPLGDIDGDGAHEYIREHYLSGVSVISGFDTPIWYRELEDLEAGVLGDLDGDGVREFFVGYPDTGETVVYSGGTFDGSEFEVFHVFNTFYNRGRDVGDVTGDGVDDFILAAWVWSGADLSILYDVPTTFGTTIGDIDGDGALDYVAFESSRLTLRAGPTGRIIVRITGLVIDSVYPAGDWNGDGVLDVAVSDDQASHNGANAGRVTFRSGDDLRVIGRIDGEAQTGLQATAALVDDLPGASRPAILLAQPRFGVDRGRVRLDLSRCAADFNCDGVSNTLDVLSFLNAFVAGDLDADVNFDDVVDTQDALAFLNLWAEGC